MSENVNFNKNKYDKNSYLKSVQTQFNQLGVLTNEEILKKQPNVEEFFKMYDDVFYIIDELGFSNSHEYLIKKSSEYINFDANQEIIEAMQKEIDTLRTELLESQKQQISIPPQ